VSARLSIEIDSRPLERVDADVAVAGLFEDDRPLRGGAARADWRLCGLLSRLIIDERISGAPGEAVLVPSESRLRAPRVLVLGLGPRGKRSLAQVQDLVRDAADRVIALGLTKMALGPMGFAGDDWPRHADAVVGAGLEAVNAADRPLELSLVVPGAAEARARASFGAVIDALGRPSIELVRRDDRRAADGPARRRKAPQGPPPLHRSP